MLTALFADSVQHNVHGHGSIVVWPTVTHYRTIWSHQNMYSTYFKFKVTDNNVTD